MPTFRCKVIRHRRRSEDQRRRTGCDLAPPSRVLLLAPLLNNTLWNNHHEQIVFKNMAITRASVVIVHHHRHHYHKHVATNIHIFMQIMIISKQLEAIYGATVVARNTCTHLKSLALPVAHAGTGLHQTDLWPHKCGCSSPLHAPIRKRHVEWLHAGLASASAKRLQVLPQNVSFVVFVAGAFPVSCKACSNMFAKLLPA